jgi:dihydroxyacetone kinase-like protein
MQTDMDATLQRRLIESMAGIVIEHAEELTELDRAIGDGDHGLNMRRGFENVIAQIDQVAAKEPPEALRAIGTMLLTKIGGASGPLYGTLFMALGREWPDSVDPGGLARAFGAAIDALKRLGRSDVGQKTMLDVLVPVQAELAQGGADLVHRIENRAELAAQATIPLKALRGRASFLGERSIGHMDPGARSSSLMVIALCKALEN